MPSTPKRALPYPLESDTPDVPRDIQALAVALDDVAIDNQGTLASRPAASSAGKYYYATDNGILYRDTGSTWVAIVMDGDTRLTNTRTPTDNTVSTAKIVDSAVTSAKIADSAVTSAKLGTSSVSTAKIIDANVTTAKIADANVTLAKLATKIVYGSINANTSAIDLAGSGGWSVASGGTAIYTITFSPSFGSVPIIITQHRNELIHVTNKTTPPSASSATLKATDFSGTVQTTGFFDFIAIG